MPQVKLTVTVRGGAQPPVPITIFLDGVADQRFNKPGSFDHTFDLEPGEYRLMVGGQNPHNGSTVADIEGPFAEEPIPSKEQSDDKKVYGFLFYFTV